MKLLFAPLKGLTDAHFRSFYFKHFGGFDLAVAPFLLSSEDEALKAQREGTSLNVPLVPQLLGNSAEGLASFSRLLKDHGFSRFNLNLGCPAPVVIKKSKGAALLAEPDYLLSLLEDLCERSALPFSVKTRLGYNNIDELRPQLKKWRTLPIEELILHGRSARQVYKGEVHREEMIRCAQEWGKPIIYNGDVTTLKGYEEIVEEMGKLISGVMIGRGIFYNPFIAEEIRKGSSLPNEEKRERFIEFHRDIAGEMGTRPKSFARLKGLWSYFTHFARIPAEELAKLKRLDDPALFSKETEKWVIKTYPSRRTISSGRATSSRRSAPNSLGISRE
ncbi:MAG: tRNA-dihydrouridine synthase family protein [Spirochaetales bacterium]|nr:tRNA-dihydrouridine synthase family protein [Spirochaetales bacterium]